MTTDPKAPAQRPRPTAEQILTRIQDAVNASRMEHKLIAAHLGIAQSSFSRAIHGHRRFTSLELALIAEVTGTAVSFLLWGDNVPRCSDLVARRCPIHGACTCPPPDPNPRAPLVPLDRPDCLLHGTESTHPLDPPEEHQ